jgi:hypothetical protein
MTRTGGTTGRLLSLASANVSSCVVIDVDETRSERTAALPPPRLLPPQFTVQGR